MQLFSKKTMIALAAVSLAGVIWIGPGRLYGIGWSSQVVGVIEKIQPHGTSGTDTPAEYMVEVTSAEGEIFTFLSRDPKWGLMAKGNRVKAKLYPAAPWSTESGGWQDARFIGRLANLPTELAAVPAAVPQAASATPQPAQVIAPANVTPPSTPVAAAPRAPTPPAAVDHKPTSQSGLLMNTGALLLPGLFWRRMWRSVFGPLQHPANGRRIV